MNRVSFREYRVWVYRMIREVDHPPPTDRYLMRLIMEVNRMYKSYVGDKSPTEISEFQIKSGVKEDEPKQPAKLSKEQIAAIIANAKARWGAFLTKKPKK